MADISPRVNKNTHSATKGVAIADGVEFAPCFAINAETAGSLTVTWLDGSTSIYYFTQGINYLQVQAVGTGAAAANLIALYNG